jgi:hypothetical protein
MIPICKHYENRVIWSKLKDLCRHDHKEYFVLIIEPLKKKSNYYVQTTNSMDYYQCVFSHNIYLQNELYDYIHNMSFLNWAKNYFYEQLSIDIFSSLTLTNPAIFH